MFSLDDSLRYWLYNRPVNMRKSFNGLSTIVTGSMGCDLRDGDVFIFVNASRNRMKILRREDGGLVIYALSLDMGRMKQPAITNDGDVLSSSMCYDDIVSMVRSALDSPYVRRLKMLSKSV